MIYIKDKNFFSLKNKGLEDWTSFSSPPGDLDARKNKEFLYFIVSDLGYVKIGHTCRGVEKRLKELQTGHPIKLKVFYSHKNFFAIEEEKKLHKKFKHLKTQGEWFTFNKEIKDYIFNELLDIKVTPTVKRVVEVDVKKIKSERLILTKEEKEKIRLKIKRAKNSQNKEAIIKHKMQLKENSRKMEEMFATKNTLATV